MFDEQKATFTELIAKCDKNEGRVVAFTTQKKFNVIKTRR